MNGAAFYKTRPAYSLSLPYSLTPKGGIILRQFDTLLITHRQMLITLFVLSTGLGITK